MTTDLDFKVISASSLDDFNLEGPSEASSGSQEVGKDVKQPEDQNPSVGSDLGEENDLESDPEDGSVTTDDDKTSDETNVEPPESTELDTGYEIPKGEKAFKVTLPDGNFMMLPEGAKISNKVDGKVEDYSLGDQLRRAGGDVAVETRLANAKRQEDDARVLYQEVSSYKKDLETREKSIVDTILSGNPVAAFEELGKVYDIAPGDLISSLFSGFKKFSDDFIADHIISSLPKGVDYASEEGQRYAQMIFKQKMGDLNNLYHNQKIENAKSKETEARKSKEGQEARGAELLKSSGLSEDVALKARRSLDETDPGWSKGLSYVELVEKVLERGESVWYADVLSSIVSELPESWKSDADFLKEVTSSISPKVHSFEKAKKLIRAISRSHFEGVASPKPSSAKKKKMLVKDRKVSKDSGGQSSRGGLDPSTKIMSVSDFLN